MNLRKRSIQQNLKEISDDSDDSQKRTEKIPKTKKSDVYFEKSSKSETDESTTAKVSKYFSDDNKENAPSLDEKSESEDDFVEVKPKSKPKATTKAKTKTKAKSKTVSEEAKNSNNPTTSKKSNKKSEKKNENISETNNTSQNLPLRNKTKIENDVEALLHMERTQKIPKISKNNPDEDEDDDDFEEVEMENLHEVDLRIASMSREAVEVTIGNKKTVNKKTIDTAARFERIFKALSKKFAIAAIKTHLVCWLNYGFYLNKICCDQELCAIVLSMNNCEILEGKDKSINLKNLKKALGDFKNLFNFDKVKSDEFLSKNVLITRERLISSVTKFECRNYLEFLLIILIMLRNMGIKTRLCVCFEVIQMPDQRKNTKNNNSNKKDESSDSEEDEEMELDDNEDAKKKGKKRKSNLAEKNSKESTKKAKIVKLAESTDDEREPIDEAEALSKDKNNNKKDTVTSEKTSVLLKTKKVTTNSKILSTDDEDQTPGTSLTDTNYRNHWLEVYLVDEERWISVEPFTMKIDCSTDMEKRFGKKILYVCGYDNDSKIKDLTKRYAAEWLTSVRRSRIGQLDPKKLWWERTLMFHQPIEASLDIQEEMQLKKMLLSKELPKSLPEFKDHPLYVLPKHLLKFQSIYPQNATPISHFRNEKIYLRDNLVTLHSRQTWLKFARIVKPFESAYKVVKGRLKHSEYKAGMRENPDLDLFGYWQTKEFEPPIAENGRIPRNEFGNVELFQPHMLPIGCVHLKSMPNLNRLCKKLNIDCVAAVVGFDAHGGFSHAVYDGWIVCEEFKETVVMAYQEYEQEEAKKLIQKKKEKVIGNWARLVKLLLIRERLKLKYESKSSVFTKINKKGKELSKCLNDDEKMDVDVKPTKSSHINTEIVGGKLNTFNKNEQVSEQESNQNDIPQTSSTKESALLKVSSRGKSKVVNKSTKTKKSKAKENFKEESEDEESQEINSDSDPEFDFKKLLKNRRQKNPPRNTKKKAIVESDEEESSKEENSNSAKSVKAPLKNEEPLKKLDKDGDVNLSESE